MSKLSLPDRAALLHAFFFRYCCHVTDTISHTWRVFARSPPSLHASRPLQTRLQTPADNTPPDPCKHASRPLQTRRYQTPADKALPDPCGQDAARPLQTRRCQTPADKALPDPCRQDPARPLQTRRCQTPADKTLPDPCRQDAARLLQTRRCCQAGAAMSACTAARTPLPATTLRSAPPVSQICRKVL